MFTWLKWPSWLKFPEDVDTRINLHGTISGRAVSQYEGNTYITIEILLTDAPEGTTDAHKKLVYKKLAYFNDALNLSKEGQTVKVFCLKNSNGSFQLYHVEFEDAQ